MTRDTTPSEQRDALRDQIETIVIAVCKVKGIKVPSASIIDAIVLENATLVDTQHFDRPEDRVALLVERIAEKLN